MEAVTPRDLATPSEELAASTAARGVDLVDRVNSALSFIARNPRESRRQAIKARNLIAELDEILSLVIHRAE